jgi:hypothetical protein
MHSEFSFHAQVLYFYRHLIHWKMFQNQKHMCPIGTTYIPAKSSWFRIRNKCVRLERHIYPQRVVGSESETHVSDWNDIYTRKESFVQNQKQMCPIGMTYIPAKSSWFRIRHNMQFIITTTVVILLVGVASSCPSVCRCGFDVDCSGRRLDSIPTDLPDDTYYL